MNYIVVTLLASIFLVSVIQAWDLESSPTTALTGSDASLVCTITPENSTFITSWRDIENEILFFAKQKVPPGRERFSATNTSTEMILKITSVKLEDEGVYQCSLLGMVPALHKNAQLIVEKHPEVFVEDYKDAVLDGDSATVAKCLALNSKPMPEIWFSDSHGAKIDVTSSQQIDSNSSSLISSSLTLTRIFTEQDNGQTFTCNVKHSDGTVISQVTGPVVVHYGVSAGLSNMLDGETKVLQENTPFQITCVTTGNPSPTVTWTFNPDPALNLSTTGELPDNFETSSNGRLFTNGVTVTQSGTTNNGTFTCDVRNNIGEWSHVEVSFTLGVYATPVTTVVTTTDATPAVETLHAGSDAAVIGGVVAVAVFVLIVAIILVVRYFMSHKGTYRTHELKRGDLEENRRDSVDEHGGMLDDESELGEKKKTEYFM